MAEAIAARRGRGAKQEAIREAAQRLFLVHGFAGTTTDAITTAAGVSKETLYRYYPNKDAIFADVLGRLTLDHPQNTPLAALDGMPPESIDEVRHRLSALVERVSASMFQPEYLALVRIAIAETPRFPELGTLYRQRVPERTLAAVMGLLQGARDRGVIGEIDARTVAFLLVGPLIARLFLDGLLTPTGESRAPDTAELEVLVDLVMKALAKGV
jgi:TetR/AcrR family transcriptional repressor of mexJK operon